MEFNSDQFLHMIEALKGQNPQQGDQRRNARAAVTAHVRIIRAGRKIREVILRDISPGGVGMISREPFQVKERFIIRLPHPGQTSQFILCAVCHCRDAEPDLFVIGAKFISLSEFKEDDCDPSSHAAPTTGVPASA